MAVPIKHQMKFQVVMMTPEWAQELLNHMHPRNRRAKERRIQKYTRDMEQDYWELTPEPICVDLDGYTTNGRNRLSAVIRSGKTVPMTLVTGCPIRAIYGQDQGATRNVADIVTIAGEELPGTLANTPSVIRAMAAGRNERFSLTNAEVIHLAKIHRNAIDFAFECIPNNVRGLAQASVRAVIARAYYKRNLRNRTREFCKVLISGLAINYDKDSGAIRLRNWLHDLAGKGKRGAARVKATTIYAKTERALVAFHDEEYIQSLIEFKKEVFPLPNEDVED